MTTSVDLVFELVQRTVARVLNMFNWLAVEMPVTPPTPVAILGLGLIGGSLLRRLGDGAVGYDADPGTIASAAAAGYRTAETVDAAVRGAELVVLAVPLPAAGEVVDAVRSAGYTGLLTDVTSVKEPM